AASTAASSLIIVECPLLPLRILITGLSQLLDRSMQERSGVGLAYAEHAGELRVGKPPVELERNQVAFARCQPRERFPDRRPAKLQVHPFVEWLLAGARDVRNRGAGTASAPQLVEGGVPCDAEQPRARRA